MQGPAPTSDADSFRRAARARAVDRIVRVRLFIAPVLSAMALTFAFFEPTPWRRVVLTGVVVVMVSISVVEWVRYRRGGLRAIGVPFNLAVMGVGQVAIVLATGGLFSPATPVLVVLIFVGAILIERRIIVALVLSLHVPVTWAMAIVHATSSPVPTLVPRIFGDAGSLEDGAAPWIAAGLYSVMFAIGARVGAEVRRIFEELYDEVREERDRSLALHTEQSRALTQLSGAIAHELKNPLASVKGLGSLIAKDLDGKSAERMSVLRREVDRMQSILEEFLNFSRPLVPLALSEGELGRLARDVARLHEGMAAERAVSIVVEGERAWLRCDPRKVHQVLMNLVQNALDASPRGATLRIAVESEGEHVRARVIDEGGGLDPDVEERAFEAGVTTKDHGSGLGLAVARSLARQHGGELTLRTVDGGCEATLTLPRKPAEAA